MSALSTNPSQGPCWWELWWRWRCSLPPWLSLSPSLTELTPIHPVDDEHWHNGQRCCTKIWEAWSGPGPRRVPPSTWPTSPCPPTRGQLCPTIWSGRKLRKAGFNNNLTALLPFFKIWSGYTLWIGKEDPRNQFETLSSAQGCSCSLSQAVEQLGYCHS